MENREHDNESVSNSKQTHIEIDFVNLAASIEILVPPLTPPLLLILGSC